MRIKNIIIGALATVILLSMTACQLANDDLSKSKSNDRLAGIFITTEHLELLDDRLYAKPETDDKNLIQGYLFEGIEGISFFSVELTDKDGESYITNISGEGISDSHLSVHIGDDEEKTIFEGTIYLASKDNDLTHYINPVYQNSSGDVYVVGGQGMFMGNNLFEGSVHSHNREESITVSENRKKKSITTVINISFEAILPPAKILILQMDEKNNIL